jgi:type IV secretion system protein VirB10
MSDQTVDGAAPAGGDVSRGRTYMSPPARLALAGGVSVAVLGFMAWGLWPSTPKTPPIQSFNQSEGQPWVQPALPAASPPPVAPVTAAPNRPATTARTEAPPGPTATPEAPVMGFWQNPAVVQSTQQAAQNTASQSAQHGPGGGDADHGRDDGAGRAGVTKQQAAAGVTARATVGKPFNLSFLLRRNTIFHCLPEQPLDSEIAGPIGCMVTENVYSADGSVVLIEAGSTVDGEVMRGPALGTKRMALAFDEIMTLKGIPIYLSASAGDTLGTVGVDGYVNEHLWQKIKGAVLLSMVDIAGTVTANESAQGGTVNLSTGANYGQSLAQQMLAHDIDIPPTLYRNQAQPLTVIVRQDIPMDDAYRLVLRETPR